MSRTALRPALRMAARGAKRHDIFAPTDIPNLVFHVDANTGVYHDAGTTLCADGETVQQWNDQSGNNRHLSQNFIPWYRATGFNGQPALQFDEWLAMVSPSFFDESYDTAITMFWIGSPGTTYNEPAMSAGNTAFASGSLREWCRFDVSNLGVPGVYYRGAQSLTGNIRCVGVSYNGATLRTIINGHLVKQAQTGNLGLSGALTIGQYSSTFQWFRGHVAEAFVWNSAADDAQMRSMCDWLLAKWGLAKPSPRKSIVYNGDSLTAFIGTLDRWPNVVADSMGTLYQSHTNTAIPGADLLYLNSVAAGLVDTKLDFTQDLQINVIWAGTNNAASGWAADGIYSLLQTYCEARYAAGWDKLIVATMLPRSSAGDHADTETIRQAYNTLIRAGWASIADGLIDVAADNRIGDYGDELDETYYAGDNVHLNAAGHAVVAELAEPVIASLL